MNKSITQNNQNEKQISVSIRRFFTRFHVSSALKAANAYKKRGIPVIDIFQYLFILIFSNRSMYMDLLTGRNAPAFAEAMLELLKAAKTAWIPAGYVLFDSWFSSPKSLHAVKGIGYDKEDAQNALSI